MIKPHSSSRFNEELSRCTVRIKASNSAGTGFGTGFFVAPQHILTCAHVVGSASKIEVEWCGNNYEAAIKHLAPNPVPMDDVYPDLAMLQVSQLSSVEHPIVALDEDLRINDRLYTFGYSDFQPNGVGTTAELEGDAWYGSSRDTALLKFKGGQFRPGLSGSPLLNIRTERVCGILKRTRGKDSALGGEGISTSILYWHFPYLSSGTHKGSGLILSGPDRERDIMKVSQRIQEREDHNDGWIDEFVYCAMPPLESARAATNYATIVDQCRKHGFVAMQLYDFPTYKSRALDTVQRMICRANLVIFDLTDEHPDVLYQLGYQDGLDVDDDAVLLVQQLPTELRLNFPPFAVKPFSDTSRLAEIVGERLEQLTKQLRAKERMAARRKKSKQSKLP